MANVIINDTNLTNIANAIREKNGTTDTYKPSEMATAIAAIEAGGGGGYVPTDEDLMVEHTSDFYEYSPYEYGCNYWILKEYGDRVKFILYSASKGIFSAFNRDVFDACARFSVGNFNGLFTNSPNLKEITGRLLPLSDDTTIEYISNLYSMFFNCQYLRTINDNLIDYNLYRLSYPYNYNECRYAQIFYNCYSLRELPKFFTKLEMYDGAGIMVYYGNSAYAYSFYSCYALNKIEDLMVVYNGNNDSVITSNMFQGTFDNCHNISKLTFKTNNDGTPKTAKWNNQIIDLTKYVGYASSSTNMTGYNSGLLSSNMIGRGEPTSPKYLEGDCFTIWPEMSKYGATQARETLATLPDTSADGGGNTVKFKGEQGKYTDYLNGKIHSASYDSSINSGIPESAIASASARGWTVSIV